jgi:NADPH-dependent 2,4-dienoyl-CoA reductase/sulfur reductase-like enzyme
MGCETTAAVEEPVDAEFEVITPPREELQREPGLWDPMTAEEFRSWTWVAKIGYVVVYGAGLIGLVLFARWGYAQLMALWT